MIVLKFGHLLSGLRMGKLFKVRGEEDSNTVFC